MNRTAINELIKWKASRRRKPLIIEGARQVGKTWLVKEFAAQQYRSIAYINFEQDAYLRSIFEQDYDMVRILDAIGAATHQKCVAGETLIFLDEIQEARNGVNALKYFYENAPEQHVIVAGSLLGIELHKNSSFPVGKVHFMTLYPMSFNEFLEAMDEGALKNMIEAEQWSNLTLFAPKLKNLLRQY